ncbi:MAG: A/G-specific adenine glycosylase [Bacteroidetes bacterium]|nr:A/G-specific adenine glycosylase [Bacteroidota bacterium]
MKTDRAKEKFFTKKLMEWHETTNDRSLPWKGEKDPYKIWLSEIILQQTRAEQGKPYYLKFVDAYPGVRHLAAADDEAVFRLWQGLGYYNRCKNMLATARYIAEDLYGEFPCTYEGLLRLKGIGPYTAAAIGSFAFGLPVAVVDGNVYRVLSRYFGIDTPFDTTEGKKIFSLKAGALLYRADSAGYNQAIMDLGATVCTPAVPACGGCVLQNNCFAFQQNLIDVLPVRSKKVKVKKRYFHYIVLAAGDKLWMRRREGKDIWQNLYEPYLVETPEGADLAALDRYELFRTLNIPAGELKFAGRTSQKLTHQTIEAQFYTAKVTKGFKMPAKDGVWVPQGDLKKLAFPKTVLSFLEKKLYF